jgi:hypothetical protein
MKSFDMRRPTSLAERWAWWEAAISGEPLPIHEDEPHTGFFAVRKFRYGDWARGPMVPARVWWEPGEIDVETGELLTDERCLAEIDGAPANPWRSWTWLARRPIPENEWQWLKALSPLLPSKIPPKK